MDGSFSKHFLSLSRQPCGAKSMELSQHSSGSVSAMRPPSHTPPTDVLRKVLQHPEPTRNTWVLGHVIYPLWAWEDQVQMLSSFCAFVWIVVERFEPGKYSDRVGEITK